MVGAVSRPERRLTKLRRTSMKQQSTRDDHGFSLNTATQNEPASPMHTDFGSLRSSAATRLQLREQFTSTFPGSETSLATEVVSPIEDDHRPSRYYDERAQSSNDLPESRNAAERSEETQAAIDVPAAIALLQELKKHATADELVALHKALLPTRRSVENVDTLISPSESGYVSHRRSRVLPGLATRGGPGSDPLQTIEELIERRKSQQELKKRQSVRLEVHQLVVEQTSDLAPHQGSPPRPISPLPQADLQAGVYRTGTLRITNRSPSPSSVMHAAHGLDGAADAYQRDPAAQVNTTSIQQIEKEYQHMRTTVQAFSSSTVALNSAMEEYNQFIGSPYDRQSMPRISIDRTSEARSSCESFKTPIEPVQQSLLKRFASLEKLTQEAYSSADEATKAERPSLTHTGDSGYASEVSSDRQSHSLESKRKQEIFAVPSTTVIPVARSKSSPALRQDKSTKLTVIGPRFGGSSEDISALPPLRPPPETSRSQRMPPPEIAELLGIDPRQSKQPKAPKSPRSTKSVKSTKSHKTVHEPVYSSAASQRLEDLFVAPGEQRPKSRRQTLLNSLGFGKKGESEASTKAKDQLTKAQRKPEAPPPQRSQPGLMSAFDDDDEPKSSPDQREPQRSKSSKKLRKPAPRHVKQARKELAKFESYAQPTLPRSDSVIARKKSYPEEQDSQRVEEDDTLDAQPDWFWQDDYAVPPVPTALRAYHHQPRVQQVRLPPPPPPPPQALPIRRRRNLSIVQEIDHDSNADEEDVPRHALLAKPADQQQPYAFQISEMSLSSGPGFEGAVGSEILLSPPVQPFAPRRAGHQPQPSVASTISSMTSGQLDLIEEVQNATIDWAVQAKFWKARRTLVGHALQHEQAAEDHTDLHESADHAMDFSSKFRYVDLPSARASMEPQSSYPQRQSSLMQVAESHIPDRYSGGLQYEWTRETGVSGSAGMSNNGPIENGRSAPSKQQYGLDLSDVPVFITRR